MRRRDEAHLGVVGILNINPNPEPLDEARALGYEPRDDAEVYADEVIAEHGTPDPDGPVFRYLGGEFTTPEFDAEIP